MKGGAPYPLVLERVMPVAGLALLAVVASAVVMLFVLVVVARSVHRIGPTEVGLVTKHFGRRRLAEDNPVAFAGEAGYQADLLMPGMRFKLWPVYAVTKFPWVQVPAGEIGVVIAQVGRPLPIGAKSARYRPEFGNFTNLRGFLANEGEKGVQRPVLPPGVARAHSPGRVPGLVTELEGEPLGAGNIVSRLGGFTDVADMEARLEIADAEVIDVLLGRRTSSTTTTRTFKRFSRPAGGSGCNTTRCSTGRTC